MMPSGIYTSTSLSSSHPTDTDPNQSLLPRKNKRGRIIYIRTEAILREINSPQDYLELVFSLNFPSGLQKTVLCTMTSFMMSCNVKSNVKVSKVPQLSCYHADTDVSTCAITRLHSSSNSCFFFLPTFCGYKIKIGNTSISSKRECKLGEI